MQRDQVHGRQQRPQGLAAHRAAHVESFRPPPPPDFPVDEAPRRSAYRFVRRGGEWVVEFRSPELPAG